MFPFISKTVQLLDVRLPKANIKLVQFIYRMPRARLGNGNHQYGVSLGDLLTARPAGLEEQEAWAVLCQAVQALQDLFLSGKTAAYVDCNHYSFLASVTGSFCQVNIFYQIF